MKTNIEFICNQERLSLSINPAVTVLDYLRNNKKLTGTKEGCREGDCGACTVLVGSLEGKSISYKSVNSCLLPVAELNAKHLVTIEGLNGTGLNIIQEQIVNDGGTQCGFCTPGFIISLTNYFINNSNYKIEEAVASVDGNICRCTGYESIKRAINNVINKLNKAPIPNKTHIDFLIRANILPSYFNQITKQLISIVNNSQTAKQKKKKEQHDFVISGGTDLYVQKWERIYNSDVSFLSQNKKLKQIKIEKKQLVVGGAVTVEEFGNSKTILKHFPQMKDYIKLFGSLPIRNRATIGGNIVNASPIADMTNILLALNASVNLVNGQRKRNVPLKKLFKGYKTLSKKENEIVESVLIKIPQTMFYFNYEKVSRRTHLDIASVNSSIYIEVNKKIIESIAISAGGVAPIPLYLENTSRFLKGKEINSKNIIDTVKILQKEISPISDARGTEQYKSLLLRQLFFSHFVKLFPKYVSIEELV